MNKIFILNAVQNTDNLSLLLIHGEAAGVATCKHKLSNIGNGTKTTHISFSTKNISTKIHGPTLFVMTPVFYFCASEALRTLRKKTKKKRKRKSWVSAFTTNGKLPLVCRPPNSLFIFLGVGPKLAFYAYKIIHT